MRNLLIVSLLLCLTLSSCFDNTLDLSIQFRRAPRVALDSELIFDGRPIGTVTKIHPPQNGNHIVEVKINNSFAHKVTETSQFFVAPAPGENSKMVIQMINTKPAGTALKDGAIVTGTSGPGSFVFQMMHRWQKGISGLEKGFGDLFTELKNIPEKKEFKRLERNLDNLFEEFKTSGREAQTKITEKIIPQLQKELEALKEQLEKLGREDEIENILIKIQNFKNP